MNAQAQAYFVQFVATKLQIPVTVDPIYCKQEGSYAHYEIDEQQGIFRIFVSDLSDSRAIAHELTHSLQYFCESYFFKLPELREYLLKIGLTPDKEFFKTFLPHWRKHVKTGTYDPFDFDREIVAYYVEYANNGWQLFQHLCRDAGII
jgi:hypothetical protein